MSYIKSKDEQIAELTITIYGKIKVEEREEIIQKKYKRFVKYVMEKFYGCKCGENEIKEGYNALRIFFKSHPLKETEEVEIKKRKPIPKEFVKAVLDYETRKISLKNILKHGFNYFHFEQAIEPNKEKRTILVLEGDDVIMEKAYKVITSSFKDLFKIVFCGYGGIAIVFDTSSSNDKFKTFLDFIKD